MVTFTTSEVSLFSVQLWWGAARPLSVNEIVNPLLEKFDKKIIELSGFQDFNAAVFVQGHAR
jgi:hypothetical protein